MKKFVTIMVLLAITLMSYSQVITKKEVIYRHKSVGPAICTLRAYYEFEDDSLTGTFISLVGSDAAYPATGDYISLFMGTPEDFNCFMNDIIKFFDQDPGTSMIINNGETLIEAKSTAMLIHDDRVSYTWIPKRLLITVRDSFLVWAKNNNIILE